MNFLHFSSWIEMGPSVVLGADEPHHAVDELTAVFLGLQNIILQHADPMLSVFGGFLRTNLEKLVDIQITGERNDFLENLLIKERRRSNPCTFACIA